MATITLLTEQEIEEIIDKFQCYPFGQHQVDFSWDPETTTLTACMYTLNSRNDEYFTEEYAPEEFPMPLRFERQLEPMEYSTPGRFLFALFSMATSGLLHEICEWTRYDGNVLYDPHEMGNAEINLPRLYLPEFDVGD